MKIHTIVAIGLASILFAVTVTGVYGYYSRDVMARGEELKRKELYDKILDGASIAPPSISINYNSTPVIGSPLVFGGSHTPPLDHEDAWNKIANSGVTAVRNDFYTGDMFENTVSIFDYQNNTNDIRNINNWKLSTLNMVKDSYHRAKSKGMKVIGIISYAPPWLTHSNTKFGVPKDWEIYEDIVKKLYLHYRDDLDYVEIWNEPNYFKYLDVTNSGMSVDEAYKKIFFHAVKAIKEADREISDGKNIPIGGPVGYNPIKNSTLEAIVADPQLGNNLNFVSYHNYDHLPEPSWEYYKSVMTKYDKSSLPIMITEWNAALDSTENLVSSPKAILYTSEKLLDYLQMGISGANYHSLDPLGLHGEKMGYYIWDGSRANLLPQAKSWMLLSKVLKLGKGNSKIFVPQSNTSQMKAIGFINIDGEHGIVAINSTDSDQIIELKLNNLNLQKYANVRYHIASEVSDPNNSIEKTIVKLDNKSSAIYYTVPKRSVFSALITQEKEWFDVFIPR